MNPYPRAMDVAATRRRRGRSARSRSPFLMREPARNQLPIMIVHTLVTQPEVYPEFRLWAVARGRRGRRRRPCARRRTTSRSPTRSDDRALDALVAPSRSDDPDAPGVVGNRPVGRHASPSAGRPRPAQAWRVSVGPRGVRAHPSHPSPRTSRLAPAGRPRRPSPWSKRGSRPSPTRRCRRAGRSAREQRRGSTTQPRRHADDAGIWLWEDGRAPSLDDRVLHVPAGARIGPVYTPPDERGRGFASNLVACASAWHCWTRGAAGLLPVHRPREPHVEQDLHRRGLRAGVRVGQHRVRRTRGR